MAEFCLRCFNEYIKPENEYYKESDLIIDYDFCEGCAEWKMCVVGIRSRKKIEMKLCNLIRRILKT